MVIIGQRSLHHLEVWGSGAQELRGLRGLGAQGLRGLGAQGLRGLGA